MTRRLAEKRGRDGETRAAVWLRAKGWQILDRRVKTPAGEIDIVTVDVTEPDSYLGLKNKFAEKSLDAIIVNAGIKGADHQSAEAATDEEIAHVHTSETRARHG